MLPLLDLSYISMRHIGALLAGPLPGTPPVYISGDILSQDNSMRNTQEKRPFCIALDTSSRNCRAWGLRFALHSVNDLICLLGACAMAGEGFLLA